MKVGFFSSASNIEEFEPKMNAMLEEGEKQKEQLWWNTVFLL